ncbi:MAG: hypothetical protein AAFO82_15185 [Bacteroidota bacterium]
MNIRIHFIYGLLFFGMSSCVYNTIETEVICEEEIILELVAAQNSSCGLDIGQIETRVSNANAIEGDIEFSINGIAFQNNGTFSNLTAGTYNVIATNGICETEIQAVIENDEGLNAIAEITASSCGETSGSISIDASDFIGNVTYSLNDGTPQSNPNFNNLAPGDYQVKVSDESGCDIELEANISSGIEYEVIEDIVKNSCAISGCHAGNVAPDFRDKETIINRSGRILARTQSKSMPPPSSGASLSNEEIESIECWVSDGSNG